MKSSLKIISIVPAMLSLAVSNFAATTNVAYGGVGLTFRPANLTINAGDTVIWINAGGPHTVTGDSPGQPLCGCSSSIPGFTNTFNAAGDFAYHCIFHQSFGMTGIVHVLPAPATPAVLTNATSFTNGTFIFTVLTTAFHTNVVQASTNLAGPANWIPLTTNFPATNTFSFTDATVNVFPNRFYRVVQP